MKNTIKILFFAVLVLVAILAIPSFCKAVDADYSMDLQYDGNVVAGEEKNANAILNMGQTVYNKVKITVKVSGPATPTLLATDSLGTEIDIAQTGQWGNGFMVGGGSSNVTAIRATFPKAGTYTITLSLVDMDNNDDIITTKDFTIEVGLNLTMSIDGETETKYLTAGTTFESLNVEDPTKDGYTFAGWYTDAEFTTPFDETMALDENTTIYAKFEEKTATVPEEPENPSEEPETPNDDNNQTEGENKPAEEEKDDTPKTGVSSYVGIAGAIDIFSVEKIINKKKRNA